MTQFRTVLLVAILVLWGTAVLPGQPPVPAEAETVAKIESLGGRVYRNASGQVDMINLNGKNIGDEHLPMLQSLPALRNLNLDGSKVTDQGLDPLLKFPALEEVSLLRTTVTPAAAKSLKERHGKVFFVALSPRGSLAALAIVPLFALPVAAVGIWLFSAARRKRDVLAPRTYVQGVAYGLLLVMVAIVMSIFAVIRFLGVDFHLSDLAG